MNLRNAFRVSLFACALANSALAEEQAMPYVLMDEDLAELKSDFNDAVGGTFLGREMPKTYSGRLGRRSYRLHSTARTVSGSFGAPL